MNLEPFSLLFHLFTNILYTFILYFALTILVLVIKFLFSIKFLF